MTDPQNPTPSGDQPPAYQPPAGDPASYQAPAYGASAPEQPGAAPAYAAPAYPTEGYGAPQPVNPGKTMGIVALILAIVPIGLQLVGLILGIVALVQSKKAGQKNGMALAAIIVSSVLIVLGVIVGIVVFTLFASAVGDINSQVEACIANGGTGYIEVWGQQLSCEEVLNQAGR
ncbi:DUF4190 domain-containing protein [Microbacterium invictum]|uniref:DUF4190 domain-containing protein n=1 Tax=Microbacterium invictum TaxID=515415 RepID=A0AA40VM94_9MICO|nr:DUF4190 domain-containing protein [Microbacterium invictum]MBB4139577.1 hypothetical protein [Microbacterium invictum]